MWTSSQQSLENDWREALAPTEEGWSEWSSILLNWVKENEKKEKKEKE